MPGNSANERKSLGKKIRDVRTLGGRLDVFPPSEIPRRVAESVDRNVGRLTPIAAAGAFVIGAGGLINSSSAKAGEKKATIEQVQRSKTQLRLDTMIQDILSVSEEEIVNPESLTSDDVVCLARNIFNEARGESFEGQLATLLVVLSRAKDSRFPDTACEVVYQPNQFSWTGDVKILMQQDTPTAKKAIKKIQKDIVNLIGKGTTIDEAINLLAWMLDLPPKIFFYKRHDWDEWNPDETRMSEKSKRQWQNRVLIKRIGNHGFYREKTKEELEMEQATVN
jgi:spore germination cell wall hydrolase CwlJ-like protein